MYTVTILSDADFDRLGHDATDGADISDSLGFANSRTNKAYVRFTASKDLNKYLIDHEFDELINSDDEHTDPKVKHVHHKKFRQVVGNIAPVVAPIVGGLFGGPIGAGIGGAIGGGLKGGIGGEKRSFGGAAKGAALGGLAGFGGSKLLGGISKAFGGGSGSGGGGSAFTPVPLGAPVGRGFNVGFGRGILPSAAASAVTPGSGTTGGNLVSNVFDFFKPGNIKPQQLLGAGALATGLFRPLPEAPSVPPSVEALRQQLQSGGSPVGQAGQAELQNLLSQDFDPLTDEELAAGRREIERAFDEREDQIRDLFRNIRPGTDEFTDSALNKEIEDVRRERAQALSDFAANRTRDVKSRFDQQRLAQIQTAGGFSNQEMNQLTQLALLDVNQISQQLQIDLEQARLFKETFLNIGAELVLPEQPSILEQFLAGGF